MNDRQLRPRGRPRHFDEEVALDALTALFWEKGYSQTTITDLVEASGVHKPSIYRTFGTKEELFVKVLRRYLTGRVEMMEALIEASGPGIDGIHSFLDFVKQETLSGSGQNGCLLVHTSSELCGTTPGYDTFGVDYRRAMRELLRPLVAQSETGDASVSALVDQRTTLFVTFLFGLDVSIRGGAAEAEIAEIIDAMHATVNTWRPWTPTAPADL